MRRGRILGIVLVLGLAGAGAVFADEVVHFTNGTFMSIRSHTIESGMVRVVLGAESEMAFPIALVEKIDSNGREIIIRPTLANVMQGGAASGPVGGGAGDGVEIVENRKTYGVTGTASSPLGPAARNLTPQERALANVGLSNGLVNGFVQGGFGGSANAGAGIPVAAPFAKSANPAKRAITLVGDRALVEERSIGAAPGVPTNEALRGASLQRGGGRSRKD